MQNLAPIALFVYNRPEHTRRTLKYLRENLLAEDSRLFVFADAARNLADEELVKEVNTLVQQTTGFKSLKLIARPTHLGLAGSIIAGVSQLVNEYGKVIVLEDDLLSSPYTLTYFNEALNRYAEEDRVMQIAAYMFPLAENHSLPETFFLRSANSWGWATWKRAWNHFDPDIDHLYQQFDQAKIERFTFNGLMNYWDQLLDFKEGKNNSWAIRWHAAVFLRNGLVLYPAKSLVENIGHDGSGVHSIIENTYDVHMSRKAIRSYPSEIAEHPEAVRAVTHFFRYRKGSWWKRGRKFMLNKWFQLKKRLKKA